MNYGGFLGGDGWSLDAGDSRGDVANANGTGSFGGAQFSRGSAGISPLVLVGVALVGLYLLKK